MLADDVVPDLGAGDATAPLPTSTDRPHLNGLRALAVYLVVFFHAGSSQLSGGYVGVDVLFVLFGFLLTRHLLSEITDDGSIHLGRFYARRLRRLLPPAYVVLIVTAVVFTAIAAPADVANAVGAFRSALLYVTNWYFIHASTNFRGTSLSENPVVHFWAPAVQAQFVLLWPLALGGLFFATRGMAPDRRMRTASTTVLVGAIASAVWALSLRSSNPLRAFYGTDTRAYELLAGASIALTPWVITTAQRYRRSTRLTAIASMAGVVLLATSWFDLDAIERGVAVTLVAVALIVSLEAADAGIAQRALSTRPMVYLGKLAYGTYLWHWIVIVVIVKRFTISTTATIAIACLVSTALAALSFEILERPVLRVPALDRHHFLVIATALTVSIVSALLLVPKIVDPAHARTPVLQSTTTAGAAPVPADLDWRHAKDGGSPFVGCLGKPVDACTVVRGTGKHVFLLGDSHAWMLIPTLEAIARRDNLTLSISVQTSCPWQQNLYMNPIKIDRTTPHTRECQIRKDDVYSRVIPTLHPDLIVVMEVAHEDRQVTEYLGPNRNVMKSNAPAYLQWIEKTTSDSVNALRADGRKVLIVEPIPVAPSDPLACLSKSKVLEQCSYVATKNGDFIERYSRQLADNVDRVWSLDLDHLVCPYLPICDPVVNGQIVKLDVSHLTAKFAKSIAPPIDAYLKDNGILPR